MSLITKTYTFTVGETIVASEFNDNFNTIYNEFNGSIDNNNISASAGIADSKLAQITTASKVHGSSLTGLASTPSGAGALPVANTPGGSVAFLAQLGTPQSNIATGSNVTVQFDTEVYDTGSDYNNSTYTFTAPSTGKYMFCYSVTLTSIDTATTYTMQLTTSNRNYQFKLDPSKFSADITGAYTLSQSVIADMDASDTALVAINQAGGTGSNITTQEGTFFSGILLG